MPGRGTSRPTGSTSPSALADPAQVPHRPVQHRPAPFPVRPWHRFREEHGIFVGEQVEVELQVWLVPEEHRTEPSPRAQVLRASQRQPRTHGAEGHIGHDVDTEVGEPCDTGILHSAVIDPALPRLVRLEDDPRRSTDTGTPSSSTTSARPTRE